MFFFGFWFAAEEGFSEEGPFGAKALQIKVSSTDSMARRAAFEALPPLIRPRHVLCDLPIRCARSRIPIPL